jgi:hypothetical protein
VVLEKKLVLAGGCGDNESTGVGDRPGLDFFFLNFLKFFLKSISLNSRLLPYVFTKKNGKSNPGRRQHHPAGFEVHFFHTNFHLNCFINKFKF